MKKTLIGMSALLLLLPTVSLAQARYITYPGAGFMPFLFADSYVTDANGGVWVLGTTTLQQNCNFPNAANGKKVRAISATFLDKDVGGQMKIRLMRKDRWTGLSQLVGEIVTGVSDASDFVQNKTIYGSPPITNRIINNNRYQFYIEIEFTNSGDWLIFHSITVKYS